MDGIRMRLNAVLRKLDGKMNPITVKELRQISRGKFLPVILIGFLFMQLCVTGAVTLYTRGSAKPGPLLYQALFSFLTAVCCLLIPAYTGYRLAQERSQSNRDLLFISALKPASIVFGKMLSAAALAALVYSVCMPFMAMTYILRGVDLLSAFQQLLVSYAIALLIIQVGILIACFPMSRRAAGLIYIVLMVWALGFGIADVWTFRSNSLVMSLSRLELAESRGLVGVLALWTGAVFSLSAALLAPAPSNRAFVPRVYISAAWIVSLAAVLIWREAAASYRAVFGWIFSCAVLFAFALIFSVGERNKPGLRVRETVPRSRVLRSVAFLFYSGSAAGFLWASIGLLLTIAVGLFAVSDAPSTIAAREFEETFSDLCRMSLYAWIGAAGALQIFHKLLKNYDHDFYDCGIALFIMGVFTWIMHDWPIAAVAVVAAGMVSLCLPWIVRQASAFKPLPLKTAETKRMKSACV